MSNRNPLIFEGQEVGNFTIGGIDDAGQVRYRFQLDLESIVMIPVKAKPPGGPILDARISDAIRWAEEHCENPRVVNLNARPCGRCPACKISALLLDLHTTITEEKE